MSETDTTPAAARDANGQAKPKPAPKPRVQHTAPAGTPANPVVIDAPKPCEDCAEADGGKGAAGLGLLICAVAGGLLYIGIDLVTGGGLSRLLGARPAGIEDDDE